MNIAITGATGFIGTILTSYLKRTQGVTIIPLNRPFFYDGMEERLIQTLSNCEVVINLAGAPISKRWSSRYKRTLYDSRVGVTRKLIHAMEQATVKPKLFISTSAVGYYPSNGRFDESIDACGEGFLSELAFDWEKEASYCPSEIRLVITRFGVVLSPKGGALKRMLQPLRLTWVATILGSGGQVFPWIGIDDLCRAMDFFIKNDFTHGIYNLVSPVQTTHGELIRKLSKVYGAWLVIKIPAILIRLLLGEASSFILEGQEVYPERLIKSGFSFSTPTIEHFLESIRSSNNNQ